MANSSTIEKPYRERAQYASVTLRGFAWVIDLIVSFLFALLVAVAVGVFSSLAGEVLFLTVLVGYYIILEARWGRTVGKQLVGIKVVTMDGGPISPYSAAVRNVTKLIGALSLVLILLGVVLIADSRYDQRLGDRLAKTLVVRG